MSFSSGTSKNILRWVQDVLDRATVRFGNNECAYLKPQQLDGPRKLGMQCAPDNNLSMLAEASST